MKIDCILLGAGKSQRFGSDKLIQKKDGRMLWKIALESACSISFHSVILVTSHTKMAKEALEYNASVITVQNKDSHLGISHSISLGLNESTADAYLFLVCDQPFLKQESILKLINIFTNGKKGIACLGFGDRRGNPVVFLKKYREQLLALSGEQGGKQILKRNFEDVVIVQAQSEKELMDIDTLEDYKGLIEKCKMQNLRLS